MNPGWRWASAGLKSRDARALGESVGAPYRCRWRTPDMQRGAAACTQEVQRRCVAVHGGSGSVVEYNIRGVDAATSRAPNVPPGSAQNLICCWPLLQICHGGSRQQSHRRTGTAADGRAGCVTVDRSVRHAHHSAIDFAGDRAGRDARIAGGPRAPTSRFGHARRKNRQRQA